MSRARPIVFSAPMVRALLDGRKTQTRRIVHDAPHGPGWYCDPVAGGGRRFVAEGGAPSMPVRWPCAAGDRLWVREGWARVGDNEDDIHACPDLRVHAYYRADLVEAGERWRSPVHMPRWVSRLTLLVTEVRVQRLQDISRSDVLAEGLVDYEGAPIAGMVAGWHQPFAQLWDRLHGDGAWDANPWVAAIGFAVHRVNVDAMTAPSEAA